MTDTPKPRHDVPPMHPAAFEGDEGYRLEIEKRGKPDGSDKPQRQVPADIGYDVGQAESGRGHRAQPGDGKHEVSGRYGEGGEEDQCPHIRVNAH